MPRLIINADDLGYSPAVNRAIADLFEAGLITSASLLVNQPFSEAGAEIALRNPGLSVGVHLNLSKGRPLLPPEEVASLVDEAGRFWRSNHLYRRALLGQVDWDEAAQELDAQVRWALQRGLQIDNLDAHVHFHVLPAARRLTVELAGRYGVRAWRTPEPLATLLPSKLWNDLSALRLTWGEKLSGIVDEADNRGIVAIGAALAASSGSATLASPNFLISLHQWGQRLFSDQQLAHILSQPDVVTELVVHPGYVDDPDLPLPDQLPPIRRQAEVDLLLGEAFGDWLRCMGFKLVNYADLPLA